MQAQPPNRRSGAASPAGSRNGSLQYIEENLADRVVAGDMAELLDQPLSFSPGTFKHSFGVPPQPLPH